MSTKMIPFYIIDLLEKETDQEHPLLITEIMDRINSKHDEYIIKKPNTILDNINTINEFYEQNQGEEIIGIVENLEGATRYKNNKRYFFKERKFDFAEILTMYNLLLNSTGIGQQETKELCDKLKSFLSKYQKKW